MKFRPRVIPVLLLKGNGLVKTKKFLNPRYVGDPINAVRIFNQLKADELIFLDILASKEGRCINAELVHQIGDEAYMPFAVGGGITTLQQALILISSGAEKVVINSAASSNLHLIEDLANHIGNQSVIVSIDVKTDLLNRRRVMINGASEKTHLVLLDYIKDLESAGAGEIMITSVNQDGMMAGYDLATIQLVSEQLSIPVIACGGAGSHIHFREAITAGACAVAAGSMFVFHGARNAVLINYPEQEELLKIFE